MNATTTQTTGFSFKQIKKQLEKNESFQYWRDAIGLSFEDFSILEFKEDRNIFIPHKDGKKDIGNYYVNVKDGQIEYCCFDMANEKVRQNTLKSIASLA